MSRGRPHGQLTNGINSGELALAHQTYSPKPIDGHGVQSRAFNTGCYIDVEYSGQVSFLKFSYILGLVTLR